MGIRGRATVIPTERDYSCSCCGARVTELEPLATDQAAMICVDWRTCIKRAKLVGRWLLG